MATELTIAKVSANRPDGSKAFKVMLHFPTAGGTAVLLPAYTERGADLLAEALQNAINAHSEVLAILR